MSSVPQFPPAPPTWSTACPDWEDRILARPQRSLVPFPPLFPQEAAKAMDIMRDLRLVRVPGMPTMGEACGQWVFDFAQAVFGSYDHATGRRLIRYFMLLVSKKNGKSTTAAAIMLTALIRNWRKSGEFYIIAPSREVALNAYEPAADMVRADPRLERILHLRPSQKEIVHKTTKAFLKVVTADNNIAAGKNTVGLFVDELWLFGKKANAGDMLKEAMGGLATNREGFVIYATTQSDMPPAGVFEQTLNHFRDVRDGKVQDPRSLGVLYEYPDRLLKEAAYTNPEYWYVTNPSYGTSVDEEFLRDQALKAQRESRGSYASFLAKHLNVQIGQSLRGDGWAGAEVWQRGTDKSLTLDTLLDRSEVVSVGIDGGGSDDMLGIAVIGRERVSRRWLGWAHAMISPEAWDRRKANTEVYQGFIRDGDLTAFTRQPFVADGTFLPEDHRYVIDLVKRIKDRGLLFCVGLDKIGIGGIVDALASIGVSQALENLDTVPQGVNLMGNIKTIETKLADGSFQHADQPMMSWCAGNAVVEALATGIRIAKDASGYGKIDPLMALFYAGALMELNPDLGGATYLQEERLIIV